MPLAVGFIGLGEVGCTFSAAMRARGVEVAAYDLLRDRVTSAGVTYRSLPELIAGADYVLSTVLTRAAKPAAEHCLPHLKPGQVYVDLNSTKPSVKRDLEAMIQTTGARFVEGAILGAVGVTGASTRILAGGSYGQQAAAALTSAGLNVSFYSNEIGKASTFKMLRSIFSKGLEALILEFLIAGRHAGIEDDLWKDVAEFMTRNPFDRVAENWLQSHAVAHSRRYEEMVQVTETMRELGIDPLMTSATERFFERSGALGLDRAFPAKPSAMAAVVAFMEEALHRTGAATE